MTREEEVRERYLHAGIRDDVMISDIDYLLKENQQLQNDIKQVEQRADGVWEENQRLRNLLNRFVIAFAVGDAGHLTLNGRSWSALEDARKELQGDTE